MSDAESPLKVEATSRLEWFVVAILFKLTRAQVEECAESARHSSGACNDSYARDITSALVGGWNLSRHVDKIVAEKHADVLAELEETRRLMRAAQNLNYACESAANDLRHLADRLDPPKKAEK